MIKNDFEETDMPRKYRIENLFISLSLVSVMTLTIITALELNKLMQWV